MRRSPNHPGRSISISAAAVTGIAAVLVAMLPGQAAATETRAAPSHSQQSADFTGILALNNCSGALVRPQHATDGDPALAFTNGHCNENGMPASGTAQADAPSHRQFTLLDSSGQGSLGTLRADKIDYSTMTGTDVTVYELTETYAQITAEYDTHAVELATEHPTADTPITVVSGYWRQTYSCSVDGFAYKLHEADWTWADSIRYTSGCDIIGGTSGSPIENADGRMIGINNTINEDGQRCTLNNPCEEDANGNITYEQGRGYGQQTYYINDCIGAGNKFTFDAPGCELLPPTSGRTLTQRG